MLPGQAVQAGKGTSNYYDLYSYSYPSTMRNMPI